MSLYATPGSDLCLQLTAVSERLHALVTEELRLLSSRRLPSPGGTSVDEKERLARVYRIEVSRIKEQPHLIASASPAERGRLAQASQRLEEAVQSHAVALEAFSAVAEGLVKAIAAEIGAERSAPRGYGPNIKTNTSRSSYTGVAFNSKA
jgi:hypothetical protein